MLEMMLNCVGQLMSTSKPAMCCRRIELHLQRVSNNRKLAARAVAVSACVWHAPVNTLGVLACAAGAVVVHPALAAVC